jgi:ankyrin repeat protein
LHSTSYYQSRHRCSLLLTKGAVDLTSNLFGGSYQDLVSWMARYNSEEIVQRAPAFVQCVDWVHSLAGDRHPNLDVVSDSTTFEIDIPSELTSVSRNGDNSRLLFSILHSAANNLLSASQASELLPVIVQNSNLKLFQALVAGRSPATKAIARTFLPGAIESLDCSLVGTLLDTGINPDSYVDISRRPLRIAIFKQSMEMVVLFLDRGADVNLHFEPHYSHDADTHLKAAVATGRLDLVQRLLRAGAHVNDPEPGRAPSALQFAVGTGRIDLVQLLLAAGADVHAPPQHTFGRTALQAAAGAGNIAVVRLLLSHGADVNTPGEKHGGTALKLAASEDNVEMTQLLISHGAADVFDALKHAERLGSSRVVTQLILWRMASHATLDDAFGRTALRAAVRCGDFELVQTLLECEVCTNAPPIASDTSSETVLQIAARCGDIKIAELLLSYGADINTSRGTATALQEAVGGNHMQLVQVLLDHGADANAPAPNGRMTALAAAASRGNLDIFQLLLDHGADMEDQGASVVIEAIGHVPLDFLRLLLDTWKDASGGNLDWTVSMAALTALEQAVEDVEITRLLLEYEADDKSLALRVALGYRNVNMEVVELLLAAGAEVGCRYDDEDEDLTALDLTASYDRLGLLRLLLEHRSDQTSALAKSRALQLSALEGKLDAARLLLDHGADVNAAPSPLNGGEDGTKTALQAAAGNGNFEMVRFLLETGADVESKRSPEDEQGLAYSEQGTALQFAAIAGSMGVVTLLIQKGADVFAPAVGRYGRTAIEGAAEHGRLDIVQLLLNLGVEAAGSKAIQFAREEGHDGVIALLEEAGWEVA